MTDQNPNWFSQNAPAQQDQSTPQPATATPATPAPAAQPAQPAGNWFEQNGLKPADAPAPEAAVTAPASDARSFWQRAKDSVAGPTSAVATPMGETKGQELSGISDVLHGNFAAGGKKIWDSEKIDKKNVVPGSPVEWAIRQFDPDFHGGATKEAVETWKAKNQNPGEHPLVDFSQFVDKDKHPIGKAVSEVAAGLTSPENIAILMSTDGLGLIEKTPQALKALGVMNKLVSAGFGYQALQGAYQHSQAFMDAMNNGDANEAEYQLTHALASGTMAVQAGSHAAEGVRVPGMNIVPVEHALPLLSDADKAVMGKVAQTVGQAAGPAVDFVKQKSTDAADLMGRAVGRTDDFDQAITAAAGKLGKAGPEFKEKVGRVSDDLKAIINNDTSNKIVDPKTAADAIQGHLNSLEAPLQKEAGAERDSTEPVVPNFRDRLEARLDKFFDDNRQKYGSIEETDAIKDKIMARLNAQQDVGGSKVDRDPNLYEAENARQGLSKSSGDVFENGTSNGYRAASADTANFLREVIDESYDNKGVTNVKEVRQKEADLIDVRDALNDAQGKYEAQDNLPALLKLFSLGKGAAIAGAIGAHFLGGDIPGGLLATGTAWKAAHDYYSKNLPSNFNRAVDLANREQGAQATTPGSVPPVAGPSVPPPSAPLPPNAPPPPTPPVPATPPAVNHALNGALSSYFGNFLNEQPYPDMMQKFVDQVADMRQDIAQQKSDPSYKPKYTQDQIDKAVKLQGQVNAEHAKEHAAVEKQNETANAKYQKDYRKWEQTNKEAAIKAVEAAKLKEEQDAAAAEVQKKAEDDAKAKSPLIAHSPVMQATEPVVPIDTASGHTSEEAHKHENGHVMAAVAEGLNPIAFLTNKHPEVAENNGAAQVWTDSSDAAEGNKGIAQRVVTHLGGPAFDEVHQDMPLNRNPGARTDIAQARKLLREEGGLSGVALDKVFDALYDRAKEHVSNPEALAIVNANAALREKDLHENFHMSPGRLDAYAKLLKGVYNGQTPTSEGIHEGATDGGLPEGESAGTGGSGEEQDGSAERVRAETPRKSARETAKPAAGKEDADSRVSDQDEDYKKGVIAAAEHGGYLTTSGLMRELGNGIGYGKATRVIDRLREEGHVNSEKSSLSLTPGVPKERTTGDEKVDAAIKEGGGIPGGVLKGFSYKDKLGNEQSYPDTALVHEPKYGSSINIPVEGIRSGEITAEQIKARVEAKRAEFEKAS